MLDGPDYPNARDNKAQDKLIKENERLKALLLANGISWVPETSKPKENSHSMRTRRSLPAVDDQLPHLPIEIQLRILRFAMRFPFPIIDPFFAMRPEHMSKDEKVQHKELHLSKYSPTLKIQRDIKQNNSLSFPSG
jgi:hypothetical protein